MDPLAAAALVVAGAAAGALLVWSTLRARLALARDRAERLEADLADKRALAEENERLKILAAELRKEREADAARLGWVTDAEAKLREAFSALAATALQTNNAQFLQQSREQVETLLKQVKGDWGTQREELKGLVEPLGKTLGTLETHVRELEQKREGAYRGLTEQIQHLGRLQLGLQTATTDLAQALKSSGAVRGRWGEMQLRRIVEMAGMVEHVDFDEQVAGAEGRPDMIVRLPNGGILPVDSKVPLEAYLAALEEKDERLAEQKLAEHARAVRNHMAGLARKTYGDQFDRTPDIVVMVVPYESGLAAAFRSDGELLEDALGKRVLIASPVTLFALLKAVGYGWLQFRMAENAQQIADEGRELYDRLRKFTDHLRRVGKQLDSTVGVFNEAVGSLESRVFPAAARLKEMGAGSAALPDVESIETRPRALREE